MCLEQFTPIRVGDFLYAMQSSEGFAYFAAYRTIILINVQNSVYLTDRLQQSRDERVTLIYLMALRATEILPLQVHWQR